MRGRVRAIFARSPPEGVSSNELWDYCRCTVTGVGRFKIALRSAGRGFDVEFIHRASDEENGSLGQICNQVAKTLKLAGDA
jgi:hypothetical protein